IINQRNYHENPRAIRFQHEFAINVRLNAARYTDFLEIDFFNYLEDRGGVSWPPQLPDLTPLDFFV
ncbi:hypothetical protein ALC62_07950, partial [Cyphomyrmex costatus]